MADAWPAREKSNLRNRVPRIDEEGRRSVCPVRGMERSVLRGLHPNGSGRMRCVLWAIWTHGPPGPDDHSDRTETRLLLSVALRAALALATFDGNARASYWPGR